MSNTAPQGAPVINRGMITVSIMLATIIQALDGTIANVALPHMQGSLSATQDQVTWVLTSFIVAAAIATPPGIQPTRLLAKRTMREAIFPSIRNWPESTKNGTAMMEKLSSPVNRRCEMMFTVSMENEENASI